VQTTEFLSELLIEMREDAENPDIAGQGYGRAVPYGVETRIGQVRESFDANAFDPQDVVGKPLAYRHGEPIGVITAAENKPDGLYIDFQIANTVQGRDAATLIRTGSAKGLSVGFTPSESIWNKARTIVRHARAALAEVSVTHMPAYATAGVSAIREEESMSVETVEVETAPAVAADIQAREAIAQVREQLAAVEARSFTSEAAHPLEQYRSFGEYVKAVYNGSEERALDVSTLADAPGLVPPVWWRDIRGVLDRGRPCINAVGGAISAAGAGLTINWPYFDGDLSAIVAAQAAENDEINSVDIDIKKGTATLATYASGNRLTQQVIERTDPSYVTAHMRILMGGYGTETDYAFQTGLWANDTAGLDYDFSADTTGAAFVEAVWAAAVDVQNATGQPAEVVYVNSAVYKKIAAWSYFQSQNYANFNASGTFDGTTVRASVMGLPLVLARNFATNETQDAIVTNSAAVRWAEDGPRTMSADVVSNLGRESAIYGYGVITPFIPAGIVGIYNQA
jgi:HK97 family phage prohead protease